MTKRTVLVLLVLLFAAVALAQVAGQGASPEEWNLAVPLRVLKVAGFVYVLTQAIKKSPAIGEAIDRLKWGPWPGIVLAVLSTGLAGLAEYGGDLRLDSSEVAQLIAGLLGAMAGHWGLSAARGTGAPAEPGPDPVPPPR